MSHTKVVNLQSVQHDKSMRNPVRAAQHPIAFLCSAVSLETHPGRVIKFLKGCDLGVGKEDPPGNIGPLFLAVFHLSKEKEEKVSEWACMCLQKGCKTFWCMVYCCYDFCFILPKVRKTNLLHWAPPPPGKNHYIQGYEKDIFDLCSENFIIVFSLLLFLL